MRDINQWLAALGLGQYGEVFTANDIDMAVLPELAEEDLEKLGVSMGHRKKLLKAIATLSASDTAIASTPVPPEPSIRAPAEGERRQATVLFADLSGYTAMNEHLDAEVVGDLLGRLKAEAVQLVEHHGGIVNQFVGDEVLALFGIPTAHEDDPVRAVRAALDLHAMVRRLSPEVESRIGQRLRLHTGIDTGLIVTNLRDQRDGLYGITGDTVNTGARLKAHAEADDILVSPEVQRLIAPFFETQALEAVAMKGKATAMIPYRVVEASTIHTRFEAAAQRGLTPYTGRERELVLLQACLDHALTGRGQFVTVVGEAGVGKSRFSYEFRHSVDRDKVLVLQGHCQSYGKNMSYLPFVDCLLRALQLRDTDSTERSVEKAVSTILATDAMLEPYLPYYLQLLSLPTDKYPPPQGFTGEEKRRAFEESLAAIFTMASRRQPMVLMLEDWHWADEASDSALKYLVGAIADHRVLVMANYRPEYDERWGRSSHHTPVVLKPLELGGTESMIRSCLEATVLPKGLGPLIHARTSGNPLFVEEICSALVEDGSLQVRESAAVLARPIEEISLPDTIQAVIRSRLDNLDADLQEALRFASVIGREFSKRILQAVHSEASQLDRALSGLIAQDLIQQLRVIPEIEYMFKHVLTQIVVYETLLLQRRKQLHMLVGQAMEAVYGDRLPQFYEALAHHFDVGAVWSKAVSYRVQAGMKAMQHHVVNAALTHFDRAKEILETQTLDIPWQVRYDLAFQRSVALGDRGRWPEAYEEMAQAEAIARRERAVELQINSMFALANAAFWAHLFDECLRIVTEVERVVGDDQNTQLGVASLQAMSNFMLERLATTRSKEIEMNELFRQVPESPHVSRAAFVIGVFHRWRGDNEAAAQFLDLAVKRHKHEASAGVYLQSLFHYCLAIGELGRYEEAIGLLEEGREYGVRAASLYGVLKIDNTLGWAYLEICNFEKAIHYNEISLMSTDEVRGTDTWTLSEVDSFARLNLGDVYATLGDLSRAQEYYEQAYENAKHDTYFLARTRWKPRCLMALGELWLALGAPQKAETFLAELEAQGFTEGFPFKKHKARLGRLRAGLAAVRGNRADATEQLRQALEDARAVGNPTQLWKTLQAFGDLHLAEGNRTKALIHMREAAEVVQGVADCLTDSSLRETFLQSRPIRRVLALSKG